jgi:hypothetical protein
MSGVHRVGRTARACAILVVCFGAFAGAAHGATLKVSMSPSTIRVGDDYTITVSGSYSQSELTGRAYLISLIQYSSEPCKATAQEENSGPFTRQYYLRKNKHSQRVGVFESDSPFSRADSFTAVTTSTRRVCAYLYPQYIGAGSTTAPIAHASAEYTVRSKKP